MKKLLLVAALSVATTSVFAQAKNFEGAYVGIDLNLRSSTAKIDASDIDSGASGTIDGLGRQSINGTLDFGYNYALDGKFLVGVGATYDLNNTTLAEASVSDDGESTSVSLKEKNHYSIYVTPGFKVSEGTLAYGKLAYHHSKVVDSVGELSETVYGLGYGAGIKTMLDKNMYLKVEVQNYSVEDD
jgi:opacity protein-like surface antigen